MDDLQYSGQGVEKTERGYRSKCLGLFLKALPGIKASKVIAKSYSDMAQHLVARHQSLVQSNGDQSGAAAGEQRTIEPDLLPNLNWKLSNAQVQAEKVRQKAIFTQEIGAMSGSNSTSKIINEKYWDFNIDFRFVLHWQDYENDKKRIASLSQSEKDKLPVFASNVKPFPDISNTFNPDISTLEQAKLPARPLQVIDLQADADRDTILATLHLMILEQLDMTAEDGEPTQLGVVLKDINRSFQEPSLIALQLLQFGALTGDPFEKVEERKFPERIAATYPASAEVTFDVKLWRNKAVKKRENEIRQEVKKKAQDDGLDEEAVR